MSHFDVYIGWKLERERFVLRGRNWKVQGYGFESTREYERR
jgi:hypothetical protein